MGQLCSCKGKIQKTKKQVQLPNEQLLEQQTSNHSIDPSSPRKAKQRPAAVSAQAQKTKRDKTSEAPNAIVEDKEKTKEDKNLILNALSKHFIFTNLTEDDRITVVKAMQHFTVKQADTIFEQGQPAKNFFVLITGKLEVLVNNKRVNIIKEGEGFGELALLHDTPRSATVKAMEKSLMWGVERSTFRKVIEEMNTTNYQENRQFIETVPLLQALTEQQKDNIAANLITQKYAREEAIVTEGDEGDRLYIIKEGVVKISKEGNELRRMYKGEFFGELALLYDIKRTASVIAFAEEVKCVIMQRDALNKILGGLLQKIIYTNTQKIAMRRSKVLMHLTSDQQDRTIAEMQVRQAKRGEIIIPREEVKGEKLYILIQGTVQKARSSQIIADKPQCIGDEYLLDDVSENRKYEDDIIAGVESDYS